jgi:hypothetical protein
MSPRMPHRPTTFLVTVILALATAGCDVTVTPGGGAPPNIGSSTPAATATGSGTAPAATGPLSTKELVWLYALEKLEKKMSGVALKMPAEFTPPTMTKTAKELRSCSRDLARAGSPGARLQPAYALVKAGCQEFDKGAACLDTAAQVGVPKLGINNPRKMTESINCFATSLEKGSASLGNALMKGEEIKTEALG